MVDAPDRSPARFPPDKEPLAAAAIGKLLDELDAASTHVAISSGACGGALLFIESCLQRRLSVEIYLPFVEEEFLKRVHQLRRRTLAAEVFWGQGARPVLAHNAAIAGAYAHWRRSLPMTHLCWRRAPELTRTCLKHPYPPCILIVRQIKLWSGA